MIPSTGGTDNPSSARAQKPATPTNATSTGPGKDQGTTFVDNPYHAAATEGEFASSSGGGSEVVISADTNEPQPVLYDLSSSSLQHLPPKKVSKNPAQKLLAFVPSSANDRKRSVKGNEKSMIMNKSNNDRDETNIQEEGTYAAAEKLDALEMKFALLEQREHSQKKKIQELEEQNGTNCSMIQELEEREKRNGARIRELEELEENHARKVQELEAAQQEMRFLLSEIPDRAEDRDIAFVNNPYHAAAAAAVAEGDNANTSNSTGGGSDVAISQPVLYDLSSTSSQRRPPKMVSKNSNRKLLTFIPSGSHDRKKHTKGNEKEKVLQKSKNDPDDNKNQIPSETLHALEMKVHSQEKKIEEMEKHNASKIRQIEESEVRNGARILELEENHARKIQELETTQQEMQALISSNISSGPRDHETAGHVPTDSQEDQSQNQPTPVTRRAASNFQYSVFRNYSMVVDAESSTSLESDTFSLMMISKVWSQSWALGFAAFLFQICLGWLIAVDQIGLSTGSSIFNVPFKVATVVRAAQFFCIILCLSTQSDILTSVQSIFLLGKGSSWDTVIGERGNKSTSMWIIRILIPNLLKFIQGLLVMFVSFVIIVQSDNIIDLLKDFTALMVLSETDNILFNLGAYGFLGRELAEQATKVVDTTVPISESDDTDDTDSAGPLLAASTENHSFLGKYQPHFAFFLRFFTLLCLFAPMVGFWGVIVRNQNNGLYFQQRYPKCQINKEFGPAYDLAKVHFADGTCYGGPLNTLGCEFEGGDCIDFNIAFPLCKGNDNFTNVQKKVGNGECDEKFMIPQCDYDGGDCCPYSIINNPLFGDNQCHGGAFNVEKCGFDSGDCNVFNEAFPDCPLSELISFDGAENITLGNGVCDGGIYSLDSCGWENGDCGVGQLGQDLKITPSNSFRNENLDNRTAAERMSLDGRNLAIASSLLNSNSDSVGIDVTVHRYDPSRRRWAALGMSLNVHDITSDTYVFTAISMNQAGDRIAIGDSELRQVRIFDFKPLNQTWVQVGQSIQGERGSAFGLKLAMTSDGSRLVISAPGMNGGGQILSYEFHVAQQSWSPLGNPIEAKASYEIIGTYFIHISSQDGNTVMFSTGELSQEIANRICRYNQTSQDWIQLGDDLPSPFSMGSSLSSSGNRVAIPSNARCLHICRDDLPGQVQVFDFNATINSWVQVGETIFGTEKRNGNGFGYSTALGDDGNILSISSVDPKCDEPPNFCGTGHVQMYHFQPFISDFVPAAPRLIENGNKISEKERDRDSTVFGHSISLSGDGSTLSVFGYNIDEKVGFAKVYDLDQVFYPRCAVIQPDWLGDGVCHDEYPYNSEECGFDYGDCPLPSVVEGFPGCYVTDPSRIGDGTCMWENLPMYNTTKCGYDGDDCPNNKLIGGYRGATTVSLGDGIGNGQDTFYFIYTEVTSTNFEIIVHMDGYRYINGYDFFAKFALIVRDGLDPGSKSYAISLGFGRDLETLYRAGNNSTTTYANNQATKSKGWLKIVRNGDNFSGHYKENENDRFANLSDNAVDGSVKALFTAIDMPENVYVGVGVSDFGADKDGAKVKFSEFQFNPNEIMNTIAIGADSNGYMEGFTMEERRIDSSHSFKQDGSATIVGFGINIYNNEDSFYFVNTEVTSTNFEIIVHMDGYINGYDYAKFALIVRDGLDPGSKSYAISLSFGHQLETLYRDGNNSTTINANNQATKSKGWLKIVRNGDNFSGYFKENENDSFINLFDNAEDGYEKASYRTIDMPENVYVGVGVSDFGTDKDGAKVKFSEFQFNPNEIMNTIAIGADSNGYVEGFTMEERRINSTSHSFKQDGSATIVGFGINIYNNEDSFYFAHTEVTSTNFEIIVHMDGYINGYDYAKFALIVRDGLDPGSKSYAISLGFGHQLETLHRANNNSTTTYENNQATKSKGWLKIVRNGDNFSGYFKENENDSFANLSDTTEDGSAKAPYTAIYMPENVYIGVGVSDFGPNKDGAKVKFSEFQFNPFE